MKGFTIAQEGHVVVLQVPVNVTGGATAQAFSMKKYQHASIIISIGAQAGQMTSIVLNACTSAAGAGPAAIPFNVFKCETGSGDVLGAKVAVTAAGFQPSATADIFYVIEIDAAELPQASPYVQVVIANGANADYAAIIAILSGARFAEDQSPTEIT
jgi:hypothetical protein